MRKSDYWTAALLWNGEKEIISARFEDLWDEGNRIKWVRLANGKYIRLKTFNAIVKNFPVSSRAVLDEVSLCVSGGRCAYALLVFDRAQLDESKRRKRRS